MKRYLYIKLFAQENAGQHCCLVFDVGSENDFLSKIYFPFLSVGEIMPVLAYIASPRSGSKKKLLKELNALQHCEAFAADNADILILVTDTPDGETEKKLRKHLNKLESLESLSMTFGYNDEL